MLLSINPALSPFATELQAGHLALCQLTVVQTRHLAAKMSNSGQELPVTAGLGLLALLPQGFCPPPCMRRDQAHQMQIHQHDPITLLLLALINHVTLY